jgi:putative SOS response-associated peptidase YedK
VNSALRSGEDNDPEHRAQLEGGANRPPPDLRHDAKAGERSFDVMRWGLVPFWAKTSKSISPTSTPKPRDAGKPTFREVFQRRLCLVPVEWASQRAGS